VSTGLACAQQRRREQPLVLGRRHAQLGTMCLPGLDDLGGPGGDRQPAAHPPGLVVVIDQVVLPVNHLQTADSQAGHLTGAAPGVTQDLIDRLVHQLQFGRGDRPGPPGRAEQVQVGIELTDHPFR
jgi:hypothetical protein